MFKNLEYISGFFAFSKDSLIKTEIMTSLNTIMWKMKYPNFQSDRLSQENVFTKCLKQEAARWLCTTNHDNCLLTAKNELNQYLSTYTNRTKIWPGWKEWIFCNGLKSTSDDTWMRVFNIYLEESDYSVLKFLTCSKNSSVIVKYIELMTLDAAQAKVITDFDHTNSLCSIIARHAKNIDVFDFILYNLENIKPIQIDVIPILTIIINHVHSKQQIDKIKEYIKYKIPYLLKYPSPSMNNYDRDQYGDEINKYCLFRKKHMDIMIEHVNHKLGLRWDQIKTQLYEYRYLIKDFDDIFRALD
ncbi:uncharacterized protein LOC105252483 [Camponotus floridanus]|uniref:uncharacterized protein LOC105252483 n=1 Tax=Camponotus floridanus TaxID=104421 RepID=UPI00059D1F62|nr:uncharacterized protein LOC105252483 [Camponotus floridanus]